MKPVNIKDLNHSYLIFLLYFVILLIFSILTILFFFSTSDKEVVLLNAKVKETDQLVTVRNDINKNFQVILLKMQQLSEYSKMNSDELNNQTILLNDIQTDNQLIQEKLQNNPYPLKSFELYKKLSNNVVIIATIKDSLFTTRYQIESLRSQLESCNKINLAAMHKLSGPFAH
ncbi:type VI secretion system TssO [Mucilaginibacter sp. L196]|uniref:type VI secretion system TssO n=1 Tax=Mucilaginibacter sp. L196 TaxID=1641870 RepID=UPI00131B0C06|nr:type VI secretion system TssO [Mucilaginibacter sp. L196]